LGVDNLNRSKGTSMLIKGHERASCMSFVLDKSDGFSFAELVKVFFKAFPHPFMMVLLYS